MSCWSRLRLGYHSVSVQYSRLPEWFASQVHGGPHYGQSTCTDAALILFLQMHLRNIRPALFAAFEYARLRLLLWLLTTETTGIACKREVDLPDSPLHAAC